MKKNIFDPFMQVKFENNIKETKIPDIQKDNYNSFEVSEMLFTEKKISFRTPQPVAGFVVLLVSESIGEKNPVGKILLKDIIIEMSTLVDLPEYIIFANSAVKLINENEELVKCLKNVKKYGTKIVVSNESLEFFNIEGNYEFAFKFSSSDIADKILSSKKLLKI